MMIIHLIRHGKTAANEGQLYCGVTDVPLSEAGIAELLRLYEQGIYPPNEGIYFSSGLLRAVQTLRALYGSVEQTAIPELAEFNFGSFEMKSYLMLKDHSDYKTWIADETGLVPCPGGESKQVFTSRVIKGFHFLAENMQLGKDIYAVCHGGVIACIMEHLFPDTRDFYQWQPEPGRGYTLTRTLEKVYSYKAI
jgi:alpha-ribazole phosphatase